MFYLKKIQIVFIILSSGLLFACNPTSEDTRPNIVLIVADDLGYADIGSYGGDIQTPHLDKLSETGIRFSRFHASPLCAPTRAMLLSGNDNHIAGMGIQGVQLDKWGYEGKITDRVALIPEILSDAGYNTYIAGKWHLGSDEATNPHNRGFSRSFVNKISSGNHYNDVGLFGSIPVTPYTENGELVNWPKGAYSTDLYTDKLIEFIGKDSPTGKPFFAFAAYTSPHWPLQVDEKYWKKYEGKYDSGYEELRRGRLKSLVKSGLIDEGAALPPLHPRVTPWDSLSSEEKKIESRKMELYAGMVDNLDFNIGRLIAYLKKIGEIDNTLIIFMSDNGAAAEDFYYHPKYGEFLKENYSDSYEDMGKANSFISYGPQWAEAGSSPFRYFKGQLTEGGMVTPMIISGPGIASENTTYHGMLSLQDIAPTLYELAETEYPESRNNKNLYPLVGNSFLSLLKGQTEEFWNDEKIFAMEHAGITMLRKGDWKLLNNQKPWDSSNFQLFNVAEDVGEFYDLKESEPEKYLQMMKEWQQFIKEVKAELPPPTAFD